MKKSRRLPTILGIIFLTMGLGIGIFLIQGKQLFRLGASPDTAPKNVRITNLTSSSATISWTTAKEVSSFITVGESESARGEASQDSLGERGYVHAVNLDRLGPSKTYYLKITSGGTSYDNNGLPWKFTTGPEISEQKSQAIIAGTLLKTTGSPAGNAVIYLSIAGVTPLSTTTSPNGSWVISLGTARNLDLASYYVPNVSDLIEVTAQAGPSGTSTAKAVVGSASSLPPMILGQTHDYTNIATASGNEDLPTATIEPPTSPVGSQSAEFSGFSLDEEIATPAATTVTLESLEEGEVVTSNKPEFFGQGPANTALSIKLESESTITDEITVDKNGDWKWSPKKTLSEGNHTLTLSWKDASGVVKNITKNFIVQAAEKPAYEASGSATPAATLPPEPVSGIGTPTLLLIISAFGLILLGGMSLIFAR